MIHDDGNHQDGVWEDSFPVQVQGAGTPAPGAWFMRPGRHREGDRRKEKSRGKGSLEEIFINSRPRERTFPRSRSRVTRLPNVSPPARPWGSLPTSLFFLFYHIQLSLFTSFSHRNNIHECYSPTNGSSTKILEHKIMNGSNRPRSVLLVRSTF